MSCHWNKTSESSKVQQQLSIFSYLEYTNRAIKSLSFDYITVIARFIFSFVLDLHNFHFHIPVMARETHS